MTDATRSSSRDWAIVDPVSMVRRAARVACSGESSHFANRLAISALVSHSPRLAGSRKFCWTNSASPRPISSLLSGMSAVCGIGIPSGCRNRAVTANQSAMPPINAASDAARMKPLTPPSPPKK